MTSQYLILKFKVNSLTGLSSISIDIQIIVTKLRKHANTFLYASLKIEPRMLYEPEAQLLHMRQKSNAEYTKSTIKRVKRKIH